MTINELASYKDKITEYCENRDALEWIDITQESISPERDELVKKCSIETVFPGIPKEEKDTLQSFLHQIYSAYSYDTSIFSNIQNSIDTIAVTPEYSNRKLTKDLVNKIINASVENTPLGLVPKPEQKQQSGLESGKQPEKESVLSKLNKLLGQVKQKNEPKDRNSSLENSIKQGSQQER
ncbi:hypothetical protein IMSAG249_01328 [Lachnospiraceae bacterium]|jgi:hypothetical protein|nr:hypothetical protein IMSAG249_01328 [Lachnospiraceae bacterium]